MEKEKLSAREAAFIAQARREAEARKGAPASAPPAAPSIAAPAAAPAERRTHVPEKLGPAERIAQLMAEERAETARRKEKMRRYGLTVSVGILVIFVLWMLRAFSRRR